MKVITVLCLLPLAAVSLTGQSRPNPRVPGPSVGMLPAPTRVRSRLLETYGRLPLAFEANQGQTDPQVKFVSRGAGYNLFLTSTEAVLTLRGGSREQHNSSTAKPLPLPVEKSAVLHMKLVGANAQAEVVGQGELPGKSNYFIGNDPKKWRAGIPQYAGVRYANVYPGVDLVYYGNQREMEYDFVLQPGADPGVIRLGIEGASRVRLIQGDLVLSNPGGEVRLRRPYTYQEVNGTKQKIRGRYVMNNKAEVGFRVDAYNRARVLVIDPVLAYATFLGGSKGDGGGGIAVDSTGNAYVTGETGSSDFPTANALQPTNHGSSDAFVAKLNADGSALVYSTYLGGSDVDSPSSIAVDSTGNAYVSGYTRSTDFPTTNALQRTNRGGQDGFVTKINSNGSALVYSTYLGGASGDACFSIAVDSTGNAYVSGYTSSTDFPTANALQPTNHGFSDAFVAKINTAGNTLIYSTYLGGSEDDLGFGVIVDSAGNAYVSGVTYSTNFPTANALQPTNHGLSDAFVAKINIPGNALIYSTYLGGTGYDQGNEAAVDTAGNVYLTGATQSTDFPTANAFQPTIGGTDDAFVTKINADGTGLVYSTYLGGSNHENGTGIAVDTSGNTYITGYTNSTDFPTANALQPSNGGDYDVFVMKINANGSTLVYSTYLGGRNQDYGGGIALDSADSVYISGTAGSANFPKTLVAFQPSFKGRFDGFVTKIASQTFVSAPLKLGFGSRAVGTTTKKQAMVTNNGANALTINRIYITGANAGDFAETNTCGTALAPGVTCNIQVTFTPSAVGPRKGVLAISDSDPASPQALKLSGTGK